MVEVEVVLFTFAATAVILAIGFTGNMIFRRTGFPELLFLLIFGMILGPGLRVFKQDDLLPIVPFLTTLAFIMILFNGGLELNLKHLLFQSVRATILAITYFILVTVAVTLFAIIYFQMSWLPAMMFGPMVAGTSTIVVLPLVNRLGLNPDTATTLAVESTITDIVNVIFLFVLLDMQLTGLVDLRQAGIDLMGRFSIGIVLGLILGIILLRTLYTTRYEEFTYMWTLAVLIGGYVISEFFGGSGVLAALILGVVLGNDAQIVHGLRLPINLDLLNETKRFVIRFQGELSFLMRSFFFVFLGLIYNPALASSITVLIASLIVLAINLALRYVAVYIATIRSNMTVDRNTITLISGQGLAHATLSLLPLQFGLPNPLLYIAVVTNVVILTNVVTSLSATYVRHTAEAKRKALPPPLGPIRPPSP